MGACVWVLLVPVLLVPKLKLTCTCEQILMRRIYRYAVRPQEALAASSSQLLSTSSGLVRAVEGVAAAQQRTTSIMARWLGQHWTLQVGHLAPGPDMCLGTTRGPSDVQQGQGASYGNARASVAYAIAMSSRWTC